MPCAIPPTLQDRRVPKARHGHIQKRWIYLSLRRGIPMPEIWINYGMHDVVLDVRAENLEQNIGSGGQVMDDAAVSERLAALDTSKPTELVMLHYSKAVQKATLALFAECEQKSHPIPRVLADARIMSLIRSSLPEGSSVLPFETDGLDGQNLVFVAEMELDGLFGYDTIATRLLRRFGVDGMLAAYTKRKGDAPVPGQDTDSIREAAAFADRFEIQGIEIVANSDGIVDMQVDHPSKTMALTGAFGSAASRDAGRHKSVIISTGKGSSNDTLSRSLSSLWSCSSAVKSGGLAILMAECGGGVGSTAIRQQIEDRLRTNSLRNPARYIDGMENLLFLSEVGRNLRIGIVSTLPEFYVKRLGMIPLGSAKHALQYILKNQGPRQKVLVASDGARTLLR